MKQSILFLAVLLLSLFVVPACRDNSAADSHEDTETATDTASDDFEPPVPSADGNPLASPLVAQGHYFRDSSGAVVLLRAVNVAGNSKVPPFKGIQAMSELEVLPSIGINAVRLLFTWEAFEPLQGEDNEDYLSYYEQVVRWADELGLYVVVDFHQDAYSRYSMNGCGEGFPGWAVSPEVATATPINDETCASWGVQMLTDDSLATTWSHFHSDRYGAKHAYVDMAGRVAARLAAHENVIGYELINEPWGSDDELLALYEQVGAKIRENDPAAILFVPPHCLVSGGMYKDTVELPPFENMAYSPHYYNGSVLMLGEWNGASPSVQLNTLLEKAQTSNVPMFLSEFGAPAGTGNVQGYMGAQLDWLDQHWVSGAQWNYTPGWRSDVKDGWNMEDLSIVDHRGTLRDNFILRPAPQRIAGAPLGFDLDDAGFTLSWNNRSGYGATVVYVPEGYADSRTLSLQLPEGAEGSCDVNGFSLECTIDGPGETSVSLR